MNNEKTALNDKKYDSAVKSIIQRDFFPILNNRKALDPSTNSFSLNSFCSTYSPETDEQFTKSIERERTIILNSVSQTKREKTQEKDELNKYGKTTYNSLFYLPESKLPEVKKSITYETTKKPMIVPQNTRLESYPKDVLTRMSPMYPDLSTESESESEFEGRSTYRKELINSFAAPVKLNTNRMKKMEISDKGRKLLNSLIK